MTFNPAATLRVVVVISCLPIAFCRSEASGAPESKSAAIVYEITGTVVNSIDGNALPHCHLSWELLDREGGVRGLRRSHASGGAADADEQGHFSIQVASAGHWQLKGSAKGFVSQFFEQHGDFFSSIVLKPTAPGAEIRFALSPESSVLGTVLDEAGEPVRNAQVMLVALSPLRPGELQPAVKTKAVARTDDRGMYEMAMLPPGSYRVMVQAKPWYAMAAPTSQNTTTDPSLDLVYPTVWYPGVTDSTLAQVMVLQGGDTRRVDLQLTPIPSSHIQLVGAMKGADGVTAQSGQSGLIVPILRPVGSSGITESLMTVNSGVDAHGQINLGGLSPGLYELRLAGPSHDGSTRLIQVTGNGTPSVDVSAAAGDMARLTIRLTGSENLDDNEDRRSGPITVSLTAADGRESSFSSQPSGPGGVHTRRGQGDAGTGRILEVPPGTYKVRLENAPDIYVAGLAVNGSEVTGRLITVTAGEGALTVHVGMTNARLSGVARTDKRSAVIGAAVLLVPVTVEDPGSIPLSVEAQTNSDGSFNLLNVIPGKYILLVVDHGWQVNWADPVTLRSYLTRGIAVELKANSDLSEEVLALKP